MSDAEPGLSSPAELAEGLTIRFPGASDDYVKARKALLIDEIALRRQATQIAARRQALPPGPVVAKDYRFHDANGIEHGSLGLIDLFGGHDTLITYFWMYGPERERPCPMCTNLLGALDGNARDIKQRAALKIIGRSTVERQMNFASERGWRNLDFVQCEGDDYARDLGLIRDDGYENPALIVYRRDGDQVRLFWMSQMTAEMADEGQDPRDYPDLGVLWSVLDLTPEGRGTDWYPKLSY
ncbi:DUF899 family protein [Sphingomonas sp. 1P06PA]|uniref:DUF899 family protein n=1 Tax=Sphingomonas sp. 1P06PA TaxID=554121 RepID=UPI0039A44552